MPVSSPKRPSEAVLPGRYTVLDTLRGLTLLSMILYHLCYNLNDIFGVPLPWYRSAGTQLWQLSICGTFLLLAGVCTHLTRRPFRRALRVGAAALLVSLVTYCFMRSELIVFGILHCITWCLLFFAVARPLLRKIPVKTGLIVNILLFAATYRVPRRYLLFQPFAIPLPQSWYLSYWLSVIGLLSPDFSSADYFPIFPYMFLFLAGHFLGRWLDRLPESVRSFSIPPLSALGRHSMAVYLLHQPVLYGVMTLIFG